MTPYEQEFHAACILSAARRLGIRCKHTSSEGNHSFDFIDGRNLISGPIASTPRNALQAACEKLADHLTVPPNAPNSHRYSI